MTTYNKRAYGIIGVKAKMANWNADFSGRPKSTSDGTIFGSDKALKYSYKHYWKHQGEPVFFMSSYKEDKDELSFRDLKETYEHLFGGENDKSKAVLENLFKATDVMNFGATFASKNQNLDITGVVQIGQGMNVYEDTHVEVQDILSPFRSKEEEGKGEKKGKSIGKKIVSNEAHYVYSFTVNPENVKEYVGKIEGFEGYTQEAFDKFKEASLVSATSLNTNSKFGCYNEIALFIEFDEEEKVFLPPLEDFMSFTKKDEISVFDIGEIENMLSNLKGKYTFEIYYNPKTVHVIGVETAKRLHLYTKKEIEV